MSDSIFIPLKGDRENQCCMRFAAHYFLLRKGYVKKQVDSKEMSSDSTEEDQKHSSSSMFCPSIRVSQSPDNDNNFPQLTSKREVLNIR